MDCELYAKWVSCSDGFKYSKMFWSLPIATFCIAKFQLYGFEHNKIMRHNKTLQNEK